LDKDAQEETTDTVRGYGGTLDPYHGQTKMCCIVVRFVLSYCLSDKTEEAAAIQFLAVFLPELQLTFNDVTIGTLKNTCYFCMCTSMRSKRSHAEFL
jgi:hypothetical protein